MPLPFAKIEDVEKYLAEHKLMSIEETEEFLAKERNRAIEKPKCSISIEDRLEALEG